MMSRDANQHPEDTVAMLPMPTEDFPQWVNRVVWTNRMMGTLRHGGPRGGRWFSLNDKVSRSETLYAAFDRVAANDGKPGVDHVSVDAFRGRLDTEIARLSSDMKDGSYRPQPVRRVYVPKPGKTEKRPLGIPTVRDRVVQTALKFALEPIFENAFHDCSYGFRPGRTAHDALSLAERGVLGDRPVVVDADIQSFFDSISHERLLEKVREKVTDRKVLDWLKQFLNAGVLEGNALFEPEDGTPQGGPLSPLLANIYLNDLDHEMARFGHRMVRYADDFVLLCKTLEEAETALARVRDWMARSGLTLHPEKTRIADMSRYGSTFEFLGFRFKRHLNKKGEDKLLRLVRDKSLVKIRHAVRKETPRLCGRSLEEIIKRLNKRLKGWSAYFRSAIMNEHKKLDGWIRRRLRSILCVRKKRVRHGLGLANIIWPDAHFEERGLFSLTEACDSFNPFLLR